MDRGFRTAHSAGNLLNLHPFNFNCTFGTRTHKAPLRAAKLPTCRIVPREAKPPLPFRRAAGART